MKKFGDVIRLYRGSSPRPIVHYITTSPDGENWIRIGDMPISGNVVTKTSEKITKEGARKSRRVVVGEIILANSMSFGMPYIMGIEGYIHDGWFVLRDYEQYLNKTFLCEYLSSQVVQNQYKRMAAGGVVQNISSDIVYSVKISIPSLPEQQRIGELLNLLNERIAIQSKVIEDLKKLKAALCASLFSQGRTIAVSLSEIGESFGTMNLSKEDLTDNGSECILYGELFTTYDRVIKDVKSRTSIDISGVGSVSGCNDLLFPASTTVDAISLIAPAAISKPGVILGGDMFGIRLCPQYNNRYMSNLLYYCYRGELASYAQGSTIIHLHYRDIEKTKLTVHPKDIQDSIADTLDLLDNRIENEQKTAAAYASQKTYLIGRLFI